MKRPEQLSIKKEKDTWFESLQKEIQEEEKQERKTLVYNDKKEDVINKIVIYFIKENKMQMSQRNIDDVTAFVKKEWDSKGEKSAAIKKLILMCGQRNYNKRSLGKFSQILCWS